MGMTKRLALAGLSMGVLFAATAGPADAAGKGITINGVELNGTATNGLPKNGTKFQGKKLQGNNRQGAGDGGSASHPLGGLLSLDTAPATNN